MTYGHAPNIGLIGRMRTGKSTAAGHLRAAFGYEALGFADPVRALAERLNPVVFPAPGDDALEDFEVLGVMRYSDAVRTYGYEFAKDLLPEFRRVLKEIGQGERERDPDVWVDRLHERLDAWEGGPVVVPDVRYPNEVARLKSLGFVVVKILRPSLLDPDEDHDSEVLTDSLPADYVYENEAEREALYAYLDGVVVTESWPRSRRSQASPRPSTTWSYTCPLFSTTSSASRSARLRHFSPLRSSSRPP